MEKIRNVQNLKERGITLIALIITIIVLLILAGVAIATLAGDSGILSNSDKAKEDTLEANVKEKVQLAIMENKIGQYSNGETLKEYLEEIGATEVSNSGKKGIMDGCYFRIKNNGTVKVSKEEIITLEDIYKDEMIGQTINYTTTNELPEDVEWVIIGKDEEGNVLATTNRPLGMDESEAGYTFNLTSGAGSWLTYEKDLNDRCAELFAGNVQGETVKVESINIEHVNALTGFEEPKFNKYTFGTTAQKEAGEVDYDYWHPDANGTATSSDGTGDPTKWSKAKEEYYANAYYYKRTSTGLIWGWEETNYSDAQYTGALNNLDFVLGTAESPYTYLLASRSVIVYSNKTGYYRGGVANGHAGPIEGYLCSANSSSFNDYDFLNAKPVRPVVTLSSDFEVEKQEDGTYKLAE